MDVLCEFRQRQADLMRLLKAIEQDHPFGDDLAIERLKRTTRATISQYEKIIHLLDGDQIGHA